MFRFYVPLSFFFRFRFVSCVVPLWGVPIHFVFFPNWFAFLFSFHFFWLLVLILSVQRRVVVVGVVVYGDTFTVAIIDRVPLLVPPRVFFVFFFAKNDRLLFSSVPRRRRDRRTRRNLDGRSKQNKKKTEKENGKPLKDESQRPTSSSSPDEWPVLPITEVGQVIKQHQRRCVGPQLFVNRVVFF